ncbi:hypothetical protein NUKP71_00120 [Klebsiella quasipneumoniae]|nr:hypothetical protein NUKP71_00120 [Klebsiella quasipneumoniae]
MPQPVALANAARRLANFPAAAPDARPGCGVTASAGLSASVNYRPGTRSATGAFHPQRSAKPLLAQRSEQKEDILAGAEANDKKYR